jgi:hypothetical protein
MSFTLYVDVNVTETLMPAVNSSSELVADVNQSVDGIPLEIFATSVALQPWGVEYGVATTFQGYNPLPYVGYFGSDEVYYLTATIGGYSLTPPLPQNAAPVIGELNAGDGVSEPYTQSFWATVVIPGSPGFPALPAPPHAGPRPGHHAFRGRWGWHCDGG